MGAPVPLGEQWPAKQGQSHHTQLIHSGDGPKGSPEGEVAPTFLATKA